jgi:hypothetical protein
MSVQRNIELIKEILANLDKDYVDSHEQLIYELGYLMGMLARMANEDSQVYHALKRTLEKLIEKRSRPKRLK